MNQTDNPGATSRILLWLIFFEFQLVDIWRHHHDQTKDFTYLSIRHCIHTHIDYVHPSPSLLDKGSHSEIGLADCSDHNWVGCILEVDNLPKCTSSWVLNKSLLYNGEVIEETKSNIKHYLQENFTEDALIWDALKAVLRNQLVSKASYKKKTERRSTVQNKEA